MKITENKIILSKDHELFWSDVQALKVVGPILLVELTNGSSLSIDNLSALMIDQAFRYFESYIKEHPHQPKIKT